MQIRDAESIVMQVLWQRNPLAAEEVIAALSDQQDWQEPTIKTLLNRLLKKGAVTAAKEGRRYLYSPSLTREAWVAQQSEGLVNRLFGGRLAPLVAHFSEQGRLSDADVLELRKLLEEMDDDRR